MVSKNPQPWKKSSSCQLHLARGGRRPLRRWHSGRLPGQPLSCQKSCGVRKPRGDAESDSRTPFPFAQSQDQESEEAPASVCLRPHRLAHELCVFPFPKQYDCRLRHPILRLRLEPACPQEGLRLSGHPCQANRKKKCDLLETASPCPMQKFGICDRSHQNLNFCSFSNSTFILY